MNTRKTSFFAACMLFSSFFPVSLLAYSAETIKPIHSSSNIANKQIKRRVPGVELKPKILPLKRNSSKAPLPSDCEGNLLCGYPGDKVTGSFYIPNCAFLSCGTETWYVNNLPPDVTHTFNPLTTTGNALTNFTATLPMSLLPNEYQIQIGATCSGLVNCLPGTFILKSLFFEKLIPQIMRNKKWNIAATFMDRWLTEPSYILPEGDYTKKINAFKGKIQPITMQWLLNPVNDTRGVTQSAYDVLRSPNCPLISKCFSFLSPKAKEVLRRKITQSLLGQSSTEFGNFLAKGKALQAQQTQFKPVDSFSVFSTLDQLVAAMGNFQLSAIPKGIAVKTGNLVKVTITDVGIYAIDSYDFLGPQSLGCWKRPSFAVARIFGCNDDEYNATNDSFNYYRNNYGSTTKFGGDFMILSDVKSNNLTKPISCKFNLSTPSVAMTCL